MMTNDVLNRGLLRSFGRFKGHGLASSPAVAMPLQRPLGGTFHQTLTAPTSRFYLPPSSTITTTAHFSTSTMAFDKRAILGKRILNSVPKFLKPYTVNFINKPVSNLTSFLILHELSAIVPLIGLWYVFHKYNVTIPLDIPQWALNKGTRIIDDSMALFDFEGWSLNDKFRLVSEGAYAFVVVKFLLPVRLAVSFLMTPLFTRYIVDPITAAWRRWRSGGGNNGGKERDGNEDRRAEAG